jgi:hypothetical protein
MMPEYAPEPTADRSAPDVSDITQAVADLEPLGGDPPCWAHLFEEDDEAPAAP